MTVGVLLPPPVSATLYWNHWSPEPSSIEDGMAEEPQVTVPETLLQPDVPFVKPDQEAEESPAEVEAVRRETVTAVPAGREESSAQVS